jgi:hypothetical protein
MDENHFALKSLQVPLSLCWIALSWFGISKNFGFGRDSSTLSVKNTINLELLVPIMRVLGMLDCPGWKLEHVWHLGRHLLASLEVHSPTGPVHQMPLDKILEEHSGIWRNTIPVAYFAIVRLDAGRQVVCWGAYFSQSVGNIFWWNCVAQLN